MPLILDEYSIENINGPVSLRLLRPIDNGDKQNYYMIFGDIHTTSGYQDIDRKVDKKSVEMYPEFLIMLNMFAAKTTTEFYSEWFFDNMDSLPKFDEIMENIRMDPKNKKIIFKDFEEWVNDEYSNNRINASQYQMYRITMMELKNLLGLNNSKYNTSQLSNLIELQRVYKNCFDKKPLCKLKNIKWQYGDIRKSYSYYFENDKKNLKKFEIEHLYSYESLAYFSDIITSTAISEHWKLQIPFTKENIDNFYNGIEEFMSIKHPIIGKRYDIMISHLFDFIIVMLSDDNKYIDGILNSYKIKKQYDKLNEFQKTIFTKDSFIQWLQYYKQKIFYSTYVNSTLEDIIKFSEVLKLLKEYIFSKNETEKDELLLLLNTPENISILSEENLEKFNSICFMMPNILFDMYFLLRSYSSIIAPKKLIVGYFGANHEDAISHYLMNIVSTHVSDMYNENFLGPRRMIDINESVNLNAFFHPEDSDVLHEFIFEKRRSKSKGRRSKSKGRRNGSQRVQNIRSQSAKSTRKQTHF